MSDVEVRSAGYAGPDAVALVHAAMRELGERYGTEEGDATPVEPAEFAPPHGDFLVAYLDGVPVACGGWRSHGGDGVVAEIKRMYTAPAARGRGIGRLLLAAVEDSARRYGRRRIILETGLRQPEAISLYESAGYQRIVDFGHYRDEPMVRSFGRDLTGA